MSLAFVVVVRAFTILPPVTAVLKHPEVLAESRDEFYEQLAAFLLEPARANRPQLLGLEFECLLTMPDGSAVPSRGAHGPDSLVLALAEHYQRDGERYEVIREAGDIALVRVGGLNFSVEPGGQVEISLAPFVSPCEVATELDRFFALLDREVAKTPFRATFLGHHPVTMPESIPLRAKPRYEIMNRRLARVGKHGIHMMRATAGMQVTLDYRSAAECTSLLRAALLTAPFVTAMFANSPLVGGKPSGYLSFRERAWWDTDPSRCGVPVRLLADDATIDDYVDFALDAELWFIRRDGELHEILGNRSFRQTLADEQLTLDDFSLHTSTLFPSARIRRGVEVRSSDCVPPEYARAFSALQAGLLYDEKNLQLATELHRYRTHESVRDLHLACARDGVVAKLDDGFDVRAACSRLLDMAYDGLGRRVAQPADTCGMQELLEPLRRVVETGEPPAIAVLRQFERG